MADTDVETTAQTETPTPIAEIAASGDFAAFERQRIADLRGRTPVVAEKPQADAGETKATEVEQTATVEGEQPDAAAEAEAKAASEAGKALAERKSSAERRKSSIQREIDELVGRRGAARKDVEAEEARIAQLRAERLALEGQTAKPAATADAPKDDPEPLITDPEWADKPYEQFTKAQARWVARQEARDAEKRLDEKLAADRKSREQAERANADQQIAQAHKGRMDAVRAKYTDFEAVFTANADLQIPPVLAESIHLAPQGAEILYHFAKHPEHADALYESLSPPMRDVIYESASAPALLAHLAQHPDEATRLASLAPRSAYLEMGKLEARLTSPKPGPTSVAAPVTNAAKPIKPVGGSATATTVTATDLATQDRGAEFMRLRDQQERERRQRRA